MCVCVCVRETRAPVNVCDGFQVSALDGVLELKGEHFWTIAFGSYVSTRVYHYNNNTAPSLSPLFSVYTLHEPL